MLAYSHAALVNYWFMCWASIWIRYCIW